MHMPVTGSAQLGAPLPIKCSILGSGLTKQSPSLRTALVDGYIYSKVSGPQEKKSLAPKPFLPL